MEVILITENTKYAPLVSPTKIIQNSYVDISNILITQVFLNHHYNIAFYVLKDNIPNQFQLPAKISKQLLDRNQGPIELLISGDSIEMSLKTQSENQLMQAYTKTQFQFYQHKEEKIIYDFRFWDIRIKLIMIEGMTEEAFRKYATQNQTSKVHKMLLFIDKSNFHYFTNWRQPNSKNNSISSKLSKEYISLKSEIENQKILFKNKVKVVESLIGENINVEKLLVEEKDQNSQFKRLRETFETIRNIDSVIIEQERKIQLIKSQIKEKKKENQQYRYQQAQLFTKGQTQLQEMKKCLELLSYKIKCVQPHSEVLKENKLFKPSEQVLQILNKDIKEFKNNFSKKSALPSSPKMPSKTIYNPNSSKKYRTYLKNKITFQEEKITKFVQKSNLVEYEHLLCQLNKYYLKNSYILKSMNSKIMTPYPSPELMIEEYPILSEILERTSSTKSIAKKRNTLEQNLFSILCYQMI